MIKVTRFNKSEFYVNPHQIEFIEATPDIVITLVSGKKIVVGEDLETVMNRIIEYRRKIGINIVDN